MKTPSLESRYVHGRRTPGDPIMTRQPDRKLWHVTCSGVRWLQARRESESCVRGRARKVSATLRGCGGSCEESSKGLIIGKMNSVPCFLRQISGLTLNGTYRRRRNVCVRVLAASPESDDDVFFFFSFFWKWLVSTQAGWCCLDVWKSHLGNRAFCVRSQETYLVAFDSVRPRYAGQSS